MMKVEAVSYVFRDVELAALLDLLDCGKIPCHPLDCNTDEGISFLEESLLITRNGERFIVDKIAAFLVKAIGEAERYVCSFSSDDYIGLFYTPLVTVVLRTDKGRWIITPFQAFGAGRDAFLEQEIASKTLTVVMQNTQGRWSCSASAGGDIRKKLLYAAEWIYFNDIPKGKDAMQWKP